jgi:hypothetical protein
LGVRWAINDVLLAKIADVGDDYIVKGRADKRVQIGHLLRPKIKDLPRPRAEVARNAEFVNKRVKKLASCLKICCIGQFAKVGVLGVFEKYLCEVFNWWIRKIGSNG